MQDCGLGSCFNQPDFKNCKRKVGCKEKKIDKTTNILFSFLLWNFCILPTYRFGSYKLKVGTAFMSNYKDLSPWFSRNQNLVFVAHFAIFVL